MLYIVIIVCLLGLFVVVGVVEVICILVGVVVMVDGDCGIVEVDLSLEWVVEVVVVVELVLFDGIGSLWDGYCVVFFVNVGGVFDVVVVVVVYVEGIGLFCIEFCFFDWMDVFLVDE